MNKSGMASGRLAPCCGMASTKPGTQPFGVRGYMQKRLVTCLAHNFDGLAADGQDLSR